MRETDHTLKKESLANGYMLLTIMPLVAVILILCIVIAKTYSDSVADMVGNELTTAGKFVLADLEEEFPGDYDLQETETNKGTGIQIMKGNSVISKKEGLFDSIKGITDIEYSLIYSDTRIITTLYDKKGVRAIGTGVNDRVLDDVYGTGQKKQYSNVKINGSMYLAVYVPIKNSDGELVGMLELAKEKTSVSSIIRRTLVPILLVSLVCIVVFASISLKSASRTLERIKKLERFLTKVSEGNLSESIDQDVLKKRDELSEAGHAALTMQKSLRNLVDKDALTEIYNRRYATGYLTKVLKKAQDSGQPFAVSIGDIDFFKAVNDTYGHEYGDIVLKEVAAILRNRMSGHGMAARFGGEEFLMVFDKESIEEACNILNGALEALRNNVFEYDDTSFSVTMTFGVVDGDTGLTEDELLKLADDKLYFGKQNGRNRVVR